MLPVIYSASSTEFSSNGQGVLIDCLSCKVTEERNGIFEMELTYPVNGQHADKLVVDAIVKAAAHNGDEGQLFRIYAVEKSIDGKIRVSGQHVSYQLSFIPCSPFTASNVGEALTAIRANMQTQDDGFTFYTDKTTVADIVIQVPMSTRAVLGGTSGSLLDTYTGEFEFDNFTVKLLAHRGHDSGVILRYGKNITDIDQESDIADTYTGLRPYYFEDGTLVQLATTDKCIWCENASSFPYKRVLVLDCTDSFLDLTDDETGDRRPPTQAELLSYANSYMSSHDFGVPSVSVQVSFEALWNTPEYEAVAPLEEVKLCDTVKVLFESLGISVESKVIKTVYDSLTDRYASMNVGSVKSSFSDTVAKMNAETVEEFSNTVNSLATNQDRITRTLLGADGGYKVEKRNGDGQIFETLYMNTLSEATADKVWRWNIKGLGYSPNGPEGPYTVAITKDGEIVADFITTGTLRSILIQNGVPVDDVYPFSVDENGKLIATDAEITGALTATSLSTGGRTSSATGTGGTYIDSSGAIYCGSTNAFTVDSAGNVTANSLTSSNATITGGVVRLVGLDSNYAFIHLISSAGINSTLMPGGFTVYDDPSNSLPFTSYGSKGIIYAKGDMGYNMWLEGESDYANSVLRWNMGYASYPMIRFDVWNGSITFRPSNPTGFVSSQHGTVTSSSGSATSVASGTWTTIGTISGIPASGTKIFNICAAFATNTSGYRQIALMNSITSTTSMDNNATIWSNGMSGVNTRLQFTYAYSGSDTTLYVRAYQNSGSSLSTTAYWNYVVL